ncbi:MAG TPA: PSD1 and planctomycete cytochrome C domain-containing protein [Chthoniobacter sp.]|jgi:hypothetical protein
MPRSPIGLLLIVQVILLHGITLRGAIPAQPGFNRDIRPILSDKCFYCHGPDEKKREAKLRLDVAESAYAEHDSGRAIVPGKPEDSELLNRILSHDKDDMMPPPKAKKPPVSAEQVATLRRWIEQGAKYEGPWAFLPLNQAPPPVVRNQSWVRNPIDRYILARLESEDITPSPEADRATLIRRLYLDLLGLLPTPEQVAAFVADPAPDAYEKLVDRTLANPHYGERWGRHWLDQARYADSNGYSIDAPRTMWPYRDWVIKALNDDLPFDEFTIEQLAGDLLPKPTKSQLIATGFHRNTMINQEGGTKPEQFRVEAMIDRTDTTGAVWLGLTVGCAQCHSHKFDPIPQREFYQMCAFFNQGEDVNSTGATISVARGEVFGHPVKPTSADIQSIKFPKAIPTQEAWEEKERDRLEKLPADQQPTALFLALRIADSTRQPEEKKLVATAYAKAYPKAKGKKGKAEDPDVADLMIMQDLAKPRTNYLLIRGDYTRPDEKTGPLQPGVITAVNAAFHNPPTEFHNRLDLARWLVNPENPLTPRVKMNRVWMHYFGRGIVETDEDFGTQGSGPTNPELLDWLASEFIRQHWSVKAMHRLIVTSATYRQSSKSRPDLAEKDPRNILLARQERVRVEAEIVRDAALSASGLLDETIGGPSVHPPQPQGVYSFTQAVKKWVDDKGGNRYRRGLYTQFYRSAPYPLLTTFDTPDFSLVCTRRARSDTPLQALNVANDPAFLECAEALAKRVEKDVPNGDTEAQLRRAFAICLSREPSPTELSILGKYAATHDLAAVARVLFNTDNFITRE